MHFRGYRTKKHSDFGRDKKMKYIGQIIGFMAIAVNIIIYQQKTRSRLLMCKLLSDVLWFLHYFMISMYTGAFAAAIGFCRELVFINNKSKWAQSGVWIYVFISMALVSGAISYSSLFSIFPVCASVISIVSFWQKKPSRIRLLALPVSFCMITYDIYAHSYAGIVNEILAISSAVLGIIRYDIKNNKKFEKA